MNSRTLNFVDELLELTGGKGVDVVLNSLAGEFIPKTLSVVALNGRFIEIGKAGIWSEQQMRESRPDVSYFPFDLGDFGHQHPEAFQNMFAKLMAEFDKGSLQLLPQKRFAIQDAISAFRYMSQAKHVGKIVVYQPDSPFQDSSQIARSDCAYLITGGLGSLGIHIAKWLVEQKAKNLILLGRNKPSRNAQEIISSMERKGVKVHIEQADVSKKEDLKDVFIRIQNSTAPLRGIIHAAGTLDDGILMHQNWQRFLGVMTSKITGSWNLHQFSKEIPLDFFVLFSSVSSLWGTPGQGNYAAANAFLDSLAHYRRSLRLPCVSINWGSWGDVGMAAELDDSIKKKKENLGLGTIDLEEGLELLGKIILEDTPQCGVVNVNWTDYLSQFPGDTTPRFFSEILNNQGKTNVTTKTNVSQSALIKTLEDSPGEKKHELILQYISKETAKLLGLSLDEPLDPNTPWFDLGLDSLSSIELRSAFELSLHCSLPATILYDHPTPQDTANFLVKKLSVNQPLAKSEDRTTEQSPSVNNANKELDAASQVKPESADSIGIAKQIKAPPKGRQKNLVAIQAEGSRPPLFMLNTRPISLLRILSSHQPIYCFKDLFTHGELPVNLDIVDTARKNIKEIKSVKPDGPYHIGGFSACGLIAFEMAQQLTSQGDEVGLLFLIEPITPHKFASKQITSRICNHTMKYNTLQFIKESSKSLVIEAVDFSFNMYKAVANSWFPLVPNPNYVSLLSYLTKHKPVYRFLPVRLFSYRVMQSIVESGFTLPNDLRFDYVENLYRIACNQYCAKIYRGKVVIHKIQNQLKTTVKTAVWEEISKSGVEIKKMNLDQHRDCVAEENEPIWIGDLHIRLEQGFQHL